MTDLCWLDLYWLRSLGEGEGREEMHPTAQLIKSLSHLIQHFNLPNSVWGEHHGLLRGKLMVPVPGQPKTDARPITLASSIFTKTVESCQGCLVNGSPQLQAWRHVVTLTATTPHYQLAVMCKHNTHFRHTHTRQWQEEGLCPSSQSYWTTFFLLSFALEVNGKLQDIFERDLSPRLQLWSAVFLFLSNVNIAFKYSNLGNILLCQSANPPLKPRKPPGSTLPGSTEP